MSYLPSAATRTITVQAVGVSLTVTPAAGQIRDTFTFSGRVLRDGLPMVGLAVEIVLDGERIATGTTDPTGAFSIGWIADRAGSFTAYASCLAVRSNTVTIGVGKIATVIVIDPLPTPIYVNEPFLLSGILRELVSGIALPGETITLSYDGITIGSVVTGSDGTWSTEATIPTAGTYRITASWPGDATHTAVIAESDDFTVSLIESALTISAPETVLVDAVFTIMGILRRVDTGAGLSGQTINISYDTVIIGSVVTAADGSYSITAAIAATGTYTLKVEFLGAVGYGSSVGTAGINIGVLPPFELDLPTAGGIALAVADAALILYYITTHIFPVSK